MVWTYILECSDDLVVDTRVADLISTIKAGSLPVDVEVWRCESSRTVRVVVPTESFASSYRCVMLWAYTGLESRGDLR